MSAFPEIRDILAAAERIKDYAVLTPVITSAALNKITGATVFIKAEMLQRTGTFKFRGAFNKISQISKDKRQAGVVAFSSGNHAQGVAAAAQILNMPATIVMPEDAPAIKISSTRSYGAEVVLYNRYTEDREAIGRKIAAETGAALIPPFDDFDIIAGQGTVGVELVRQTSPAVLDLLLCPCGGGGLIAGTATAFAALSPATSIYSVEPAQFNDTARALLSGRRERNDPAARSICDALLSESPGALTFEINKKRLKGGLTVTDEEVKTAIAFAAQHLKLVAEPGGAVALAAILHGKIAIKGMTVGIVCSGGNIDITALADYMQRPVKPI